MTVCLLQLAESKTEESCLEEKSIRKTLPEEFVSTEDVELAISTEDVDVVTTNKKKLISCCNSLPRDYIEPFSVKEEFGKAERTCMSEVLSTDAAISLPDNVILELLQASQVAADSFSGESFVASSSDVLKNQLQEKSSDIDWDKFTIVIFTNQCTSLKLQEIDMMRRCIYLGSFSRSTLSEKELIFVPHTEVQPYVLLELFRHLPKAFPPYVITECGESKVLCLKKPPDLICHFKKGPEGKNPVVRGPEPSSSLFNVESINVFKAPGIYLTRCLELISVPGSAIQESISKSSLTNTDEEITNSSHLLENNLSKHHLFTACRVADCAMTTHLTPGSGGNCCPQRSYFGTVGQESSLFTESSTNEVSLSECADALNTFVGLIEATDAVPDANVDGQLIFENIGSTFSLEPGKQCNLLLQSHGNAEGSCHNSSGEEGGGQSADTRGDDASTSRSSAPVQKNLEQFNSIEGSLLPLNSGWSEEAREESWCSAEEALSSGDSKEDFAPGILLELRSLSHSLLDVFDIIQRTPPLTKKVLSLPREVLSQHKVLHASTSSLESCPLAQSECFCGDEVGVSKSTRKRHKRRKKCSM